MKLRSMLAGLLVFAAVLPAQAQPLELSLETAIDTALKNNLGVQIQSYDYRILGENALATYGLYDWNSSVTLSTSEVEQATADVTQSSNSEAQAANLGLNHVFRCCSHATLNASSTPRRMPLSIDTSRKGSGATSTATSEHA